MTDPLGWLWPVAVGLLVGTLPLLITWAARANARAFVENYPGKEREAPSVFRGTMVILALGLAWVFAIALAPAGKPLIVVAGIALAEVTLFVGIARVRRRQKQGRQH